MALPTISRWEGRFALVTGASYGIGSAICKSLAQHNINVIGCGRNKGRIEALADQCAKAGFKGTVYPFQCDLTKEAEIELMFRWIERNHGGIDICINNAGVSTGDSIIGCSLENMTTMLETNVLALISCDNKALKSMMDRGVDDGHIIHINSLLGHYIKNLDKTHAYGATKYAVTAITEGLRQELIQRNSKIRVTSISPSMVNDTNFQHKAYGEELSKQLKATLPMLNASDIADSVIYVLSAPETVQVHDILIHATGTLL